MEKQLKRCTRCILPETFPNITFDHNGVCNYCNEYDRLWSNWKTEDYKKSEEKLKKIIKNAKSLKRKYDCLVPFSGGKDSTYVLYLCKKVYKMNVLAVNFDNGFQTIEAIRNIKNAAEILNVDLIIYKPRWEITKKLTALFLLETGEACTPCNTGIGLTINRIAQTEKIPIIFNGISPRSDERSPKEIYTSTGDYFLRVVKENGMYKELKHTIYEEMERQSSLKFRITRKLSKMALFNKSIFKFIPARFFVKNSAQVVLPEYVEWNEEKIFHTIQNELKWQESKVGKEHTDCLVNPVKCYLRHQRWGFGSKTQKLSALVRDGQMNREEALKKIKEEGEQPEELKSLLEKLDLDPSQADTIRNSYHMKYVK